MKRCSSSKARKCWRDYGRASRSSRCSPTRARWSRSLAAERPSPCCRWTGSAGQRRPTASCAISVRAHARSSPSARGRWWSPVERPSAPLASWRHWGGHSRSPRDLLYGQITGKPRRGPARRIRSAAPGVQIEHAPRHQSRRRRRRGSHRLRDRFGCKAFKIRLVHPVAAIATRRLGRSEAIIPAVRKAVGPDIALHADANSCYTPDVAIAMAVASRMPTTPRSRSRTVLGARVDAGSDARALD